MTHVARKERTIALDAEYVEVDASGAEFRYRIGEDGCAHIVRCRSCATCVHIPEAISGCPVVGLDASSFANLTKVQRIVCPRHLRHIGCRAFERCMDLCSIEFNDSLEAIDAEAFLLCRSLDAVDLPCSLRKLGVNLAGAQGARFDFRSTDIRISPESPYLFADEQGVVYERTEDGLVLVDGTRFSGSVLTAHPQTIAIGVRALALNAQVEEVRLPEGCRRIEREAFRGCSSLRFVNFPDSLEEIQRAAFSCTALESVRLPRRCVRIHETALVTGPVNPNTAGRPYAGSIRQISVDPLNPMFCMCGEVLCRRVASDLQAESNSAEREMLEAIACPNKVDEVNLPETVVRVSPYAFAGTTYIGHLNVSERIACPEVGYLLPHLSCGRFTVRSVQPIGDIDTVSLEMPERGATKKILEEAFADGLNVERLLAAYDEALPSVSDRLVQARQMIARLASPLLLADGSRQLFESVIVGSLNTVCANFGARSYWTGFEQMVDAGLLDAQSITAVIGMLTELGDAPASGYLLGLKQRRFGKVLWDYDL
ncbi:MAG: leucine-rich repeat domain-containing protein [Eggerthellaceae bacterium]|nr:leucine-rich repeat domain-containing protein [Eggerthellaceae bacterium]